MQKIYEVAGTVTKTAPGTVHPGLPFVVVVTNDDLGCTVSVRSSYLDLQYTIPFDQMLKDLLEDAKNEKN